MRKRQAWVVILSGALALLTLASLASMSCATTGSKPAASPSPAASDVKLTVSPPEGVATKDGKVTISATGLKPNEDIRIRITTSPELDVTTSVDPALKVTEGGTFETKLSLQNFPAGSYNVKLVGRGEQDLDSKPLTVKAAPPAKPKPATTAAPKPTTTAAPKPTATTK